MKRNPKIKIIRIEGGEVYFVRYEGEQGVFWEEFYKKDNADTRFKASPELRMSPRSMSGPSTRPIPVNFCW